MIDEKTDVTTNGDPAGGTAKRRLVPKARAYTGEELEAAFDCWVADRSERAAVKKAYRTPEATSRTFRRTVAAVVGVVLLGTAVFSNLAGTSYEKEYDANLAAIGELQQAAAPEPAGTSKAVDGQAVAALTERAAGQAQKVADGQNRFATLYLAATTAPDTGNGTPATADLDAAGHRRDLAQYWDPASLTVAEPLAYQWTTAPVLDAGRIDPRFPWYVRYDGLKASDPTGYMWSVDAVMPDLSSPTTAQVVWANKERNGTVLAWATAAYTDATRKFSRLSLVVTAEGARHLPMTAAALADQVPGLSNVNGTGTK
ncbi:MULTISPECIES: hypothetical protein [Arthrobacter]|uniref:Uncharacterized protein n=1 Tax=Arthrobacter terricola TaxID=2547396 RepID=A0A4R5K7T1_9MICC|nr:MULTISPECIES: hypothetical protein [Arthrobacter]MBT8163353.1 hypothetical protein [Arthrobacter sp. GN70]TDF90554.1 hypothetical protein E1809_22100 [Arthrobacter terricola]